MPEITTKKITLYTPSEGQESLNGKGSGLIVLAKYTTWNFEELESAHSSCLQYEIKLSRFWIEHTRLIYK